MLIDRHVFGLDPAAARQAHRCLGLVLRTIGDVEGARSSFSPATLKRAWAQARHALAGRLKEDRNLSGSIACREAVSLQPTEVDAALQLVHALKY